MARAHVVFIHGLANKPEADALLQIWRRKLAQDGGIDLDDCGVTSEMVYWADALYPAPDTNLAAYEALGSDDLAACLVDHSGEDRIDVDDKPQMLRLVSALGLEDLNDEPADAAADTGANRQAVAFERIPLPEFARKRIMQRLARDAYLYFYNRPCCARPDATVMVRDELRRRFVDGLAAARAKTDRLVVVSHSMGTIIAYDCLWSIADCPRIDGLMTVGSPLGLDEVQDFFGGWTRDAGFPTARVADEWVNVYDRLDIIAAGDPALRNDYRDRGQERVSDVEVTNEGTWRHSISKYLQRSELRASLARLLGEKWA